MEDNRVIYYSPNDLFYGYNLSKIQDMPIPAFETININDAIEYYEIKRYFDEGIRSKSWSDDDFEQYSRKSQRLHSLTMRFFNQLQDNNIVEQYDTICIHYHQDFWWLFDNCQLYKTISPDIFAQVLQCEHIAPYDILCHKKIF